MVESRGKWTSPPTPLPFEGEGQGVRVSIKLHCAFLLILRCFQYRRQYSFCARYNFLVAEAQDLESATTGDFISVRVVLQLQILQVNPPVDFNHESFFCAAEVNYEAPKRMLSPELQTSELMAPQTLPAVGRLRRQRRRVKGSPPRKP